MADKEVETNVNSSSDEKVGLWGPYWIDKDIAVVVFIDNGVDISFARTTDAGVNWATTEIAAGSTQQVACWFDLETPGDTGNLVHIVWGDSAGGDLFYRTVDVSDGSLGTQRTIDATVTISAQGSANRIAITKTVNGNLLAALETQTEIECYRSVDAGVIWTSRADVFETLAVQDWVLLFPANVDPGDAVALYWDSSANEISLKMYDDSANTWTEFSPVISTATDDLIHMNMDGAIRHSDSHLLMAFHSNDDTSGDVLKTFDLTVDDIDTPTVTAKADVFTTEAAPAQGAVFINQQNDDVYVSWLGGGTWQSAVDVVYKKSIDDMGSWEAESAYSEDTSDDLRLVQAGRTVGNDGGRYQPTFYNDRLTSIWVNLTNDIETAAAGGVEPLAVVNRTLVMPGRTLVM